MKKKVLDNLYILRCVTSQHMGVPHFPCFNRLERSRTDLHNLTVICTVSNPISAFHTMQSNRRLSWSWTCVSFYLSGVFTLMMWHT